MTTRQKLASLYKDPGFGKSLQETNFDPGYIAIERQLPVQPFEPQEIKDLSVALQVYIFNVGPLSFNQSAGSFGSFHIPAVPYEKWGLDVSEPVVIPGLPSECYLMGEFWVRHYHRPMRAEPCGISFAREVIGDGPLESPVNSLIQYGVFVSKTNPPKQFEIDLALAAIRATAEKRASEFEEDIKALREGRYQSLKTFYMEMRDDSLLRFIDKRSVLEEWGALRSKRKK